MCPEYGARDPDRVLEVKQRLDGTLSTYHCRRLASAPGEVVVYFPLQRAFDLHGVALPVGSASCGYFWESRPYNVYHFIGPEGETRVFYCNISDRTRISEGEVRWRDLVVDVLIDPLGATRVVDEEQLPVGLSTELRDWIASAREALIAEAPRLVTELETRTAALVQ